LFSLTLAEARLASLVGSGQSPRDAASRLNITEGTARTVLKRVFSKTGTTRQAELAALLSSIPRAGDRIVG
jgi:DNA-binding CsgD family transcriptional regulator